LIHKFLGEQTAVIVYLETCVPIEYYNIKIFQN